MYAPYAIKAKPEDDKFQFDTQFEVTNNARVLCLTTYFATWIFPFIASYVPCSRLEKCSLTDGTIEQDF